MIKKFSELIDVLKYEKNRYFPPKPYNGLYIMDFFLKESYQQIWKFQKYLRISEYLYSHRKNFIFLILYAVVGRKKNKMGSLLGIYIPEYVFDRGLLIDHYGSITVNGRCRVGENCRLHGNNCIGNKGVGREIEVPTIGDNVDIGFGSVIIGNVHINNNVIIGANSVVTKNIDDEGATVIGIPARIL